MRLLNSCSGEMRVYVSYKDVSYKDVPPYAILSHTWNDDEVSYHDWQTLPWSTIRKKKGFQKIEYCCQQAAQDGLEWVWIDTCCIDQTSSAELTESINAMFRWYQGAAICYAYLADVAKNLRLSTIENKLRRSRWFTRGWTLQELIAPSQVVFFSMDWHQLGTKSELAACISDITQIDQTYLNGTSVHHASIAQRMSWAANRETSRDEDVAYCLLGIFDVNMPLIYGEGEKSFQRLQEEIMKMYPEDHTLFAWGTVMPEFSRWVQSEAQILGEEQIPLNPNEDNELLGLLAHSPRDFRDSGKFVTYSKAKHYFRRKNVPFRAPEKVGRTIRIDLPVVPETSPLWKFAVCHGYRLPAVRLRIFKVVVLACGRWKYDGDNGGVSSFQFVTVPLLLCMDGSTGRTRELVINERIASPHVNSIHLRNWQAQLLVEQQPQYCPSPGDVIFRRLLGTFTSWSSIAHENVDAAVNEGYIRWCGSGSARDPLVCLTFTWNKTSGFVLGIARVDGDNTTTTSSGSSNPGGTGNLQFILQPIGISPAAYDRYVEDATAVESRSKAEEVVVAPVVEGEEAKGKKNVSPANKESSNNSSRRATRWSQRLRTSIYPPKEAGKPTMTTIEEGECKTGEEGEEAKAKQRQDKQTLWFRSIYEACWHLSNHWQDALYSQTMPLTPYTWEMPETDNVPYVRITSERLYLDDDPEQPVDVVDLIVTSKNKKWASEYV
ncbi:heterokaryon incompatibility protein-domain-containing protein [Hypoxylon sp. FL1284]|nr:heterokaryon incompatibility protein-domain-containing protein [Hypoxylon sp. FL1284]